jgi:hypothetical protein
MSADSLMGMAGLAPDGTRPFAASVLQREEAAQWVELYCNPYRREDALLKLVK